MKRVLLFFISALLFIPLSVLGKEELTITYDSNDGTNRTKVETIEKGDSYRLAVQGIFGLSKGRTSLEDRAIVEWNTKSDNTGMRFPIDRDIDDIQSSNYSYLNDSTNITLYAIWEDRKDISAALSGVELTGDGAIIDGEGNYSIDRNKSYNIKFSFKETSSLQFGQLSYYKLPDYFLEVLDEDARDVFKQEKEINIRVSYRGQTYNAKGTYYIEGDYLYLNLLRDGTYENYLMFCSTNITIRIWYYCNVLEEYYNNRLLKVKQYEFNISDSTNNSIKVYPKGKIVEKYINEDGEEQLVDDITTKEILGTQYRKSNLKIDGYELVEISNDGNYLYEEETQTVYYRYRKINNNILKNPKTLLQYSVLVELLLIIITAFIILTIKLKKNKKIVKNY